jgi:sugar-specific transcriptional regulator TrmB
MTTKKTLEKKLEEAEERLDATIASLSEYGDLAGEMLSSVERQVKLLGDQLDMRLRSLPKDAKEARISKLDIATLARILNRWARDLRQEEDDFLRMRKGISKEAEALSNLYEELGDLRLLLEEGEENPKTPELGLGSVLRQVETTP